jgi:peptidyl-prolyl cis-trans isomerase SurA
METRKTIFQKKIKYAGHRWLLPILMGLCLAGLGMLVGGVAAQQTQIVDRVVAIVNSDIITLYDLNRAFKPYEENIKALGYPPDKEQATLFQVRNDILNQLIDSQLADQKIKRDQISVSQNEIDATIERMKETRSITDEQMREGLAAQGLTIEEYRKEIEAQILRTKLVNREVKSKIVITKEDIKAYFDSHPEEYASDKKYYLWNIFIKASGSDKTEAFRLMKGVESRLKQGSPFESLVKEFNESSSAVQGTDLGLYRRDELSEELRAVVGGLKTGEFSSILDTNFGYQIIYVGNIETSDAKSLETVEAEIQQKLYDEFVNNRYQDWLEDLRARSHIRIIN